MGKIRNRYILVIVILSIFGVLQGRAGYSDYSKEQEENPLKDFPIKVDGWSGKSQVLEEKIYRILETNSVLVNRYIRGEELVTLSIVYYSDEKVDFHSPEGCSVGKGDKVEKEIKSITLDVGTAKVPINVNAMTVYRAMGGKDRIYYFSKTGDFMGRDYLMFRYHMAMKYIKAGKTSGALITLTTPVVKNISSSDSTLKSFMESFRSKWIKYL